MTSLCVSASMPPDMNSEFDLHLERSIQELDDLRDDLTFDVFMVYARGDIPGFGEEDKKIHPRKIYEDLTTGNDLKVYEFFVSRHFMGYTFLLITDL